jgi:putative membrane protein
MKKIVMNSFFAIIMCFAFAACDSGQNANNTNNDTNTESTDAMKSAEKANDEKEDNMETSSAGAEDYDFEDAAEFAMKAADGGMFEVDDSKLAAQKASSTTVKNFAKKMVTDHTKTNNELKSLASKKNITLPATMSDDHKKKLDKLSGLTGADFDEEYMEAMDKDHEKDVKLFEKAAEDDDLDAEIKAFAAKTLPTLRMHSEMADSGKEMAKKMDMDTIGISKKNR